MGRVFQYSDSERLLKTRECAHVCFPYTQGRLYFFVKLSFLFTTAMFTDQSISLLQKYKGRRCTLILSWADFIERFVQLSFVSFEFYLLPYLQLTSDAEVNCDCRLHVVRHNSLQDWYFVKLSFNFCLQLPYLLISRSLCCRSTQKDAALWFWVELFSLKGLFNFHLFRSRFVDFPR